MTRSITLAPEGDLLIYICDTRAPTDVSEHREENSEKGGGTIAFCDTRGCAKSLYQNFKLQDFKQGTAVPIFLFFVFGFSMVF